MRIVSIVVLIAGGVALVTHTSGNSGPPHPKEWDPRVLDLVRFDEEHRGLKFKEPVFVDFLDAQGYSDRIRSDKSDLTDEDRESIATTTGELRALGLMTGDIDLFNASNKLVDTGSLAFYSPETERITVRGTEMTVGLRVTLAHELTHALQDQNFEIGGERTKRFTTSEEATAFRAVLEGDAVRIENQYIDTLSSDEKQQYETEQQQQSANATTGLASVPVALQAFQLAPYAFGPQFVELLDVDGGQSAVDKAFEHPPVSEQQLVDPRVYNAGTKPRTIDSPSLHAGVADDAVTDSGDLGWVTWYVFLAERLDPFEALQAADGWAGDAYVAYNKDGKTCMNIAWQGATATDLEEMQRTVSDWVGAMPPGAATTATDGDVLTLTSCDPGADSGITINNRALDAIQVPGLRSEITLEAVRDAQLPLDKAFTAADCVVRAIPFDQWVAVDSGALSHDDFQAKITAAVQSCLLG